MIDIQSSRVAQVVNDKKKKSVQVITEWTASLESGVVTGPQAPEVNQGSKVTEVSRQLQQNLTFFLIVCDVDM